MEKPIMLEQIVNIGGLHFHFAVDPNIKKREIMRFFEDITDIMLEIDTDINYVSPICKTKEGIFSWMPFVIGMPDRITRCFQTREGDPKKFDADKVESTYLVIYRKNPSRLPEWSKDMFKENMYRDYFEFGPNLIITSQDPKYSVKGMLDSLESLPYVGFSERFCSYVFNPGEVIDSADDPKSFLTKTGRVLRIYEDQ